MNVGCLIKSIFAGIFGTFFSGLLVGFVLIIIHSAIFDEQKAYQVPLLIVGAILTILSYPYWVYKVYQGYKKKTTCPRCKTPFSWYEKGTGSKTLSEGYVSEDVKVNDSKGYHYQRQGFRVGKREYYYRAACKECGYIQDRMSVGSYKERV